MLILTRWLDETIIIGEDIKVKVIGVRGRQVRLGIEAPKDVSIFREELLEESPSVEISANQEETSLELV